MVSKTFIIIDPAGIHARPATVLVNAATKLAGSVEIEFNGQKQNLKSIMGILSLGVKKDSEFTIHAETEEGIAELEKVMKENKLID